jgi:hypothetical protein
VLREVFAHSTLLFDATMNHTPAVSFRKGFMSGILSAPGTRPAGAAVRITGQLIEMLIAGRADLARLVSTPAWHLLNVFSMSELGHWRTWR